jgi:hypothetical protein
MDLYKPQQQQQSGLGTALAGGLNLGGSLLGGRSSGKLLSGRGFLGGKYFSA